MGSAIVFVLSLASCAICTLFFVTFAAHYFLTTIIESGSGNDEVHYPSEGIIEWWWKPIFCLWILGFFVISGSILLTPIFLWQPQIYLVALALWVWLLFPLGLLSALFTSNWCFFLHPILVGRMLKHNGAFAYVHVITLISVSLCGGLVFAALTQSFLWALPAAFMVPTAILFYARHWGRFAWLSINYAPRKSKPHSEYVDTTKDEIPEMAVQEIDEAAEGVRAGLPPTFSQPHGIQTGMPGGLHGVVAGPPPKIADEEDEWATNKKPYGIIGEEASPAFEQPEPGLVPMPMPSAAAVAQEEEDEWATDKKPYVFVDNSAPPEPQSAANTPVTASKYYEERFKKEKAEKTKRQREAEQHFMPTPSKKTPTFSTALFFGVWEFMIYQKTLHVWGNLVVLTIVELFFLMMVVRFWPRVD